MSTPADHAAACISWLEAVIAAHPHDAAATVDGMLSDGQHPTHHAVDALADAADSTDEITRIAGISAIFAGLVEPLNDGFTPAGRAAYGRWFTRICWRIASRDAAMRERLASFAVAGEADLFTRYDAARRRPAPAPASAARVLILSRVTVGADLLLTTVAVQRLRRAYPAAELVILGDGKLQGLLGGFPGVRVRPIAYGRRGPLRERLASWLAVVEAVAAEAPDLVVAPDSRLDQLGIMPVIADPSRYHLWENILPDGQAISLARALDADLARWLGQPVEPAMAPRTALDSATAVVASRLEAAFGPAPLAAVKLDHGGNPAKSLPREAEVAILTALRAQGWRVCIDRGFGPAELANSDELLAAAGWTSVDIDDSGKSLGLAVADLAPGSLAAAPVIRFHGSIAGWAAAASVCRLAISYDSVGHHLAAGLGVPGITAFTGHIDPRFPVAWHPQGPGAVTMVEIATAAKTDPAQWRRVVDAIPAVSGGGSQAR